MRLFSSSRGGFGIYCWFPTTFGSKILWIAGRDECFLESLGFLILDAINDEMKKIWVFEFVEKEMNGLLLRLREKKKVQEIGKIEKKVNIF